MLRIDRASGAIEPKKLPSAMLLEAVSGGVAYGCLLGESGACKLQRVPLDGGAAKQVAALQGLLDGTDNGADKGAFTAMFAPADPKGGLDLRGGRYSIEKVDLESGARSPVASAVGIGQAVSTPAGVLFAGARSPGDNVGSPSWGLWLFPPSGEPKRLTNESAAGFAADAQRAYYVTSNRELHGVALGSLRDQQLTAEIAEPAREPDKIGINPSVTVAQDGVYVATASVKACWIWQVPRP